MSDLYYAKAKINDREIDLLISEDQLLEGISEALNNPNIVCEKNPGTCWPIQKPTGCPIWKKIFGICGCE
jgi:hypothetical protein